MTALAETVGNAAAAELPPEPVQRLGLLALKTSGLVLASSALWGAGAIAGIELAPPAHVQLAPSIDIWAHLKIGANTKSIHATNIGDARQSESLQIGRKHIGFEVDIAATDLLKTSANGSIGVEDIKTIGPILDDSKPEVQAVVSAEENQLGEWGSGGAAAVLLIESGIIGFSRCYRRRIAQEPNSIQAETERMLRPFYLLAKGAIGMTALGLVGNATLLYASANHDQQITADPVLNGTPFQGWEISGNIEGPLNQAVPFLSHSIKKIRSFAATAIANANQQIETKLMPRGRYDKILLSVDDEQGRLVMMWLSGAVAKTANVDGIIDAGDYALTGTSYDAFLVNAMRDRAGPNIPIINSLGAHDNETIAQLEIKAHEMVANGNVQHFAGLSVEGINVTNRSVFMAGPLQHIGDKSQQQVAEAAAQESCSQHVQIVFTHDKDIGQIIAKTGCAKLVDDGNSYDILGPTQYTLPDGGISTEATSGSAGALKGADGPSIGLPSNPAVITFQKYNTLTNEPVSYQVLTINTDATATLSPEISMSIPYNEFLKTGRTQIFSGSPLSKHVAASAKTDTTSDPK